MRFPECDLHLKEVFWTWISGFRVFRDFKIGVVRAYRYAITLSKKALLAHILDWNPATLLPFNPLRERFVFT